jgi:hypothetical protein
MRTASLITVVLCTALTGCVYNAGGRPVPANNEKPVKAGFEIGQAEVIDERFMLLPVDLEGDKFKFASTSVFVSPSAWSGSSFGSYHHDQAVNIVIADLADGTAHHLFDRPVAIGGWGLSYIPDSKPKLRFADTILFYARTSDLDKDNYLTDEDPLWLYRYSLSQRRLKRISPPGYQVVRTHPFDTYILLTLVRKTTKTTTQPTGHLSIYRYHVDSDQGKMVIEDLKPQP